MSFGYKVTITPQHQRQATIQAQAAASSRKDTSHIVYEGTPTQLTVIRVPLDLPIYRMANGRTQTQQLSYIAQKNLGATYFSSGEENESVQQIQHDILKIFVNETTESLTPISEELARTKQTEPILITPSGVVVNGNRRLCAMRELYTEKTADFPSFATVECAVLPPLTPEQVEEVEIRLQMTPETKLQYGWIDECLKIQSLLDKGRSEEAIARLMRQSGVGPLRKALQAQKYAEIYLQDWQKKPKDYQIVQPGQQFFNDLVGRLRGKTGELLEANFRIAWILFDNRTTLGSRIYNFNKVIGERAPEVLNSLAERLEVDEVTEAEAGGDEDLDIDLGDEAAASSTPYRALIKVLDDETRRIEVTDHLKAVCQTIIDAKETTRVGSSALSAVREAHSRLIEVDLTGANPRTYDAIDRQLDEVIHTATHLKAILDVYRAGNATAAGEEAN